MTDSTDKHDANKLMMVSFRIDRDLYTKFGAIAKRERLTVTDVLTGYIQRCTDNDKTEYGISIDTYNTDTYDTDKFNDAVMTAVSGLNEKLTLIEQEIDRLKKLDSIGPVR